MQYKQVMRHPGAIIFFMIILFYFNWLFIINPALKIYQKQYVKIEVLKTKIEKLKSKSGVLNLNLEDKLKKQFPSLKFTTSNNKHQWQIHIVSPSSSEALSILDIITSQSYPVISNFMLKPIINSNNFELIIIF
jgi:hypothetical protein